MIIAIDGPAGVGKSSIALAISKKLGIYYLNSGNFYRGLTLKILQEKLNPESEQDRLNAVNSAVFEIINGRFYLDGKDVEDKLHTREIDLAASYISSDPKVREVINIHIHNLTKSLSIIAEGRDMTTVVFPDADFKFYFDAKPEIRAKRRFDQKPDGMTLEQILDEINKRDENDKNKPVGSLKIAPDAMYIDTSYLTINEVCDKVQKAIIYK